MRQALRHALGLTSDYMRTQIYTWERSSYSPLSFRALEGQVSAGGIDFAIRSFQPRELAVFIAKRTLTVTPYFFERGIVGQQDADLLPRHRSVDARTRRSKGTYGISKVRDDGVKKPHNNVQSSS